MKSEEADAESSERLDRTAKRIDAMRRFTIERCALVAERALMADESEAMRVANKIRGLRYE